MDGTSTEEKPTLTVQTASRITATGRPDGDRRASTRSLDGRSRDARRLQSPHPATLRAQSHASRGAHLGISLPFWGATVALLARTAPAADAAIFAMAVEEPVRGPEAL